MPDVRARVSSPWRILPRAWMVPGLVGVLAFRLIAGTRMLLPTNIGFLRGEDQSQHYLGWAFFRDGPWTLPYGASPDWGLDFSNSVLYSDSIPLLAFAFKPFSPLLPEPFQYFGLWVLSCFVLQAWFGWKLAGRASARPVQRGLACALLVFSPPMLARLAGHWALMGHWIVLAALYLWATPEGRRRTLWWSLLVAVAALSHMYLFLLAGLLWGAAWVTEAVWGPGGWPRSLAQVLAVPGAALAALWQAGFFLVQEGKAGGGYGRFGMNLNALWNPVGWSHVLPTLGVGEGAYEGFAYLGLGGLILVAAALPAAVRLQQRGSLPVSRRWFPMAVLFAALTVLAVSNHVLIGSREFVYPLPASVLAVANIARASGRLFWPVYYTILLAALALVVRGFRPRTANVLLACVLAAQVLDAAPGWRNVNPSLALKRRSWETSLTHGFWFQAPEVYGKIRVLLPRSGAPRWRELSDYAVRHRMATDAAFLSRVDRARYMAAYDRGQQLLREGGFQSDTIYVFEGGNARRVPCVVNPEADLLAVIDDMWVLAPGWKARFGDRYSDLPQLPCPSLGSETLGFSAGGNGLALLGRGWSRPEDWGTWNEGTESVLNLHVDPGAQALDLDVDAFVPPEAPPLEVAIGIDGAPADTWRFEPGVPAGWRRLPLPEIGGAPKRLRVTFSYSATRAPSEWNGSRDDHRRLAFALRHLRVVRAVSAPAG